MARPMSDAMAGLLGRAQSRGPVDLWPSHVNTAFALAARGLGKVVFVAKEAGPTTDAGTVLQMAEEFCHELRGLLTVEELTEVVRRNREDDGYQWRETKPGHVSRSCASHDFTDPNEAMAETFRTVFDRYPDASNEEDCAYMNDAWDTARDASFALGMK